MLEEMELHNMYALGQSQNITKYARKLYLKWNIWVSELQDVCRVLHSVTLFEIILTNPNCSWCYETQHNDFDS